MPGVALNQPPGGVLAQLRQLLDAAHLNVPVTENPNPGTPANEVQISVADQRTEPYTLTAAKLVLRVEATAYTGTRSRRDANLRELAASVATALRGLDGYRRNSITEIWNPTEGAVRSVTIGCEVAYVQHYTGG